MITITEITVKMLILRGCSPFDISIMSYYSGKPFQIRVISSQESSNTIRRIMEIAQERVIHGHMGVWALLPNVGINIIHFCREECGNTAPWGGDSFSGLAAINHT